MKLAKKIYVKGYGFLPFVKKMGKNLSNKYGQKLFDNAKKYQYTNNIKWWNGRHY